MLTTLQMNVNNRVHKKSENFETTKGKLHRKRKKSYKIVNECYSGTIPTKNKSIYGGLLMFEVC